jgi:hypothetical protein
MKLNIFYVLIQILANTDIRNLHYASVIMCLLLTVILCDFLTASAPKYTSGRISPGIGWRRMHTVA